MRRKVFTLAYAMSLLTCAATVVLSVRSINHCGWVWWVGPSRYVEVQDVDGVAGIMIARDHGLWPRVSGTTRIYGWFRDGIPFPKGRDRASLSRPSFNRWGFGFHVVKTVGRPKGNWAIGGRTLWIAYVPYWFLATITAMPPLLFVVTLRRRARRRATGICAQCGYDLRASPDRCPECGTPVSRMNETGAGSGGVPRGADCSG
jgi:hypothetical protein